MPNFSKNKYEIVYAADNNFAPIMGVSIVSLFENNRDAEEINLTILDSGISSVTKDKINLICQKYSRKSPRWVPAVNVEKKLSTSVNADRGSLSQYSRLFLTDVYSKEVKRVLYLDCDTLVVSDIKKLWNTNLGDNVIAALKDAFSKQYRGNVNLPGNAIMFNSGVMLIDLDKWRQENIEGQLIEFIKSKNGKVQQGDQGALNAVLSAKTTVLAPQYNAVSLMFVMSYAGLLKYRKPVNYYSEKEISNAISDPVIVHFTSGFNVVRPWFKDSNHPKVKEWLRYKLDSPWKNMTLSEENNSKGRKIAYQLFYKLPKFISLNIAGILQAYVRPLKNRFI